MEQVAPPVEEVKTPPVEKVVETKTPEPKAVIDTTGKTKLEIMMESIGLVDIATLTDDIPVSLMYARDDNFTGKILYKDLSRAYLHPEAARALLKWVREMNTSASITARPILASETYSPPSTGTRASSEPFRPSPIRMWQPVEKGEKPLT